METLWGAIITALVLLLIPVVGWFSRRATKEGRLTLRVERLGTVYVAMPDSDEREMFKAHYLAAISDLNSWLDIDARALRQARRATYVITYLLGMVLVVVVSAQLPKGDTVASTLAGFGIALVIIAGTFGGGAALERLAARKQERELAKAKEADDDAKVELFRKGEPLTKES